MSEEMKKHVVPITVEEPDSKAMFLRQSLGNGDVEGIPLDIDQLLPSGHIMLSFGEPVNRRFVFNLSSMVNAVCADILKIEPTGKEIEEDKKP